MKYLIAISLIILVAGCHTRQIPTSRKVGPLTSLGPHELGPHAMYDAKFYSRHQTWAPADLHQPDSYYDSHLKFYDMTDSLDNVSVSLNDVPLSDSVVRGWFFRTTNQDLNFPNPVTWSVKGRGFPNFTHITASLPPLAIIAPRRADSIKLDRPIDIRYSALGCDSLMVHVTYQGMGIWRRNKSQQMEEVGTSAYYWTANTGHFTVPAYVIDTVRVFKSFNPTGLFIDLFAVHCDTIHVDGKICGFVTEVATNATLHIKR